MTYDKFVSMGDLSMPPILVTNYNNRSEFMKKCTEAKLNIFKTLMPLVTDDSLARHKTASTTLQRIAVRLQATFEKMFQIPHNLLTRADYKMLMAWGCHNAYVKGYATKDYKLNKRDWTDQHEAALTENVYTICKEMYKMAMANGIV